MTQKQKFIKKLDFEGWRAIMEGVGYALLATSFMEKILGKIYLFLLPLEAIFFTFCYWKNDNSRKNGK